MVLLRIVKRYDDVVLNRRVEKGEQLEVDDERGRYLVSLRLAEILRIDKLSKKKNGRNKEDNS